MDIMTWIKNNLNPLQCNSEQFFYDEMESQSNYCLPLIYQPFDVNARPHWGDRGATLDFLFSVRGEGKKLLDFGPGDGWPSLIVAPFAGEVIGVDGSLKRVQVCSENASRMGLANTKYIHVPPGKSLPFEDSSFDGVMAATSIEQTTNPRATLQELLRILKPGGRLRIGYESLDAYRDGRLKQAEIEAIDPFSCWLTLYDRHPAIEKAHMVRLKFNIPADVLSGGIADPEGKLDWKRITPALLKELSPQLVEARCCDLTHPSGKTFLRWLLEAGFSNAQATHSGDWFARQLFDQIPAAERPDTLQKLDELLRPMIRIVVQMSAPVSNAHGFDALLTAIK
jgi:SAM-dependent methyltransferase